MPKPFRLVAPIALSALISFGPAEARTSLHRAPELGG